MAPSPDVNPEDYLLIDENPERLDEQHIITTRTFGFLIHPNISFPSTSCRIADVGAGSGIWLLDVAKVLPTTCQLVDYDLTASAFPAEQTRLSNVSFRIQDMYLPFPAADLGTFDVVATRFTSSVASRAEFTHAVANLMTLLKPGGWLQWVDSCNFALYSSTAGTSRAACQEIYRGLEPFRDKVDPVIGLFMRETKDSCRDRVLSDLGLVNVHEDVFSSDKVQEPELQLRSKGTRNIIDCFLGCLGELVDVEGSSWTKERIERLKTQSAKEINDGVYHTLDQVCIIGQKGVGGKVLSF